MFVVVEAGRRPPVPAFFPLSTHSPFPTIIRLLPPLHTGPPAGKRASKRASQQASTLVHACKDSSHLSFPLNTPPQMYAPLPPLQRSLAPSNRSTTLRRGGHHRGAVGVVSEVLGVDCVGEFSHSKGSPADTYHASTHPPPHQRQNPTPTTPHQMRNLSNPSTPRPQPTTPDF